MSKSKARERYDLARLKRVPQRLCVGCRQMRPKRDLIRIVRTPDGFVSIDDTGRKAGRGAYICPETACLEEAARSRRLEQALHQRIDADLITRLHEEIKKRGTGT